MNIKEFISRFNNHPVLFIGTGISLRYLENSYTWDGLLRKISFELKGNDEFYYDLKSSNQSDGRYNYESIATILEKEFNTIVSKDRNGKFKDINDMFYRKMSNDINYSRFKIYLCKLLSQINYKQEYEHEITELKKVRKNISSIISTNYDTLIEHIFGFKSLIGNDILLSNPYGSLYKIHGCVSDPKRIIITKDDYEYFNKRYELIRAQLLSLFIHNPIVFLGYSLGDDNIKSLLKTIFTYVDPNTEQAEKIRSNFLLVEFDKGSSNTEISDFDIDMVGYATIRINKIKTDNFIEVYRSISDLLLPVSAMDIRKVQTVVREIYSGGTIKVNITEDIESLDNEDKVLVIGSVNSIKYVNQKPTELIRKYFEIIEESNYQQIAVIDQMWIQKTQYFPIYGFSEINTDLTSSETLKNQQDSKIESLIERYKSLACDHDSIDKILQDNNIPNSKKINSICIAILEKKIILELLEEYLRNYDDKNTTDYRKLICVYDFAKYK